MAGSQLPTFPGGPEAEVARRYPPGSMGAAFQVYIRTPEWTARASLTRDKIWWPAWFRIRDMWGDVAPDTITFEMMSKWRAALEKKHGRGVAHKTLRVWRTFWKIMLGMRIARTADPSMGIRNRAPAPRWQRWSEGETVRLVKTAWRHGYHGLACVIAVAWDTQFSPVDVRTLRGRHRAMIGGRLVFDRQTDGRTKTGRAAIGTLSARTERLVNAYFTEMRIGLHPDGVLFRTRTGNAYGRDTLAHDFAAVRALAFTGDKRRLMDMRRSGVIEAIAGDAGPLGLAAKLAGDLLKLIEWKGGPVGRLLTGFLSNSRSDTRLRQKISNHFLARYKLDLTARPHALDDMVRYIKTIPNKKIRRRQKKRTT
jgi:hypothetical protein